ncbi:hypothetical protein [Streptomyces sp. RKAG293]|uniref:zinc finger domain-containing protein n=1 Tax=Streptomyces sp. RKAG293 TaxID=2893403 RepID=UPI002033A83E|nr:hypothetical protein [Streptomyces sp. RKAG293]MCM2420286.1 hypothetical protein [Streptomyces sp. RKAG293]
MERREVAGLLAYMGRLDPRTMRSDQHELRDQIEQWHELLGEVPLATAYGWDARDAIRAHVLSSPYPILPVDIARKWTKHSSDRLARHTDPTPAADPDDPHAWRAELLGTRHAVAAGQRPPHESRALTSDNPHPDLAARLRAIGSVIPPAIRAELSRYRPARAAREAAAVEGRPDPLSVRCEWCKAPEGEPCRARRTDLDGGARGNARRATPHPSRLDLATAALNRQEYAA